MALVWKDLRCLAHILRATYLEVIKFIKITWKFSYLNMPPISAITLTNRNCLDTEGQSKGKEKRQER